MICSSQRPLPDNTQHSQQTDIHAPGGIRTHDLSRQAAVDLRLRPCAHWDQHEPTSAIYKSNRYTLRWRQRHRLPDRRYRRTSYHCHRAARFCKVSAHIYRNIRYDSTDDSNLHGHCLHHLKYYELFLLFCHIFRGTNKLQF